MYDPLGVHCTYNLDWEENVTGDVFFGQQMGLSGTKYN